MVRAQDADRRADQPADRPATRGSLPGDGAGGLTLIPPPQGEGGERSEPGGVRSANSVFVNVAPTPAASRRTLPASRGGIIAFTRRKFSPIPRGPISPRP